MSTASYQIPTQEDAELAQESSRLLAALVGKGDSAQLRLHDGDETFNIPVKAVRLLVDILESMARGDAVSLVPVHKELTTQEAANILNVSRPYLVKQLEKGDIPHHKVGVRRKVYFQDLMDYMQRRSDESQDILDTMTEEAQELEMGY